MQNKEETQVQEQRHISHKMIESKNKENSNVDGQEKKTNVKRKTHR